MFSKSKEHLRCLNNCQSLELLSVFESVTRIAYSVWRLLLLLLQAASAASVPSDIDFEIT
jgi:hypothetical protein